MVTSTWRVLLRVLPSCSRRAVGSIRPRAISTRQENQSRDYTAEEVPEDRIRNFSIVAHVDHGKSTLADRLLEITNTVSLSESVPQLLDQLPVERERGITVKAQTATMYHEYNGHTYMLNLIDTPGHVDFSYEVSRSLAACHGVVLLVDAQQGVQAQTVANFLLSTEAGLTVLPAINKIDLKLADVDATIEQMNSVFGFTSENILKVSAKLGTGVPHLLNEIIDRIPCPPGSRSSPLKMLLFDSWYDKYRGVICLVAVQDGAVQPGDLVSSVHTDSSYKVMEVGLLRPKQSPQHSLGAGQVGYLILGMRVMSEAHIGDTLHHTHTAVEPAVGFKPAQPMVFAGLYPTEQSELPVLRSSLEKLCLNDRSVMVKIESSVALGQGWRLGFLGLLHMEVFTQRLEEEFGTSVILTSPSVPCKAILKTGEEVTILNPAQFPPSYQVDQYLEPIVTGRVVLPDQYLGKVLKLCEGRRGVQKEMLYLDSSRILLKYELPLGEVVVDFYHQLKTITSGYGSFDYEDNGYQPAKLVKLNILLNGVEVDALSSIVHTDKAYAIGKKVCAKLKETIHRQLFEIAIQAASGSKVIARETVRALRKDVTAKCYGGDMSRRMKLLKRQKEGKKRLRSIGKVELSKQAFLAVLER